MDQYGSTIRQLMNAQAVSPGNQRAVSDIAAFYQANGTPVDPRAYGLALAENLRAKGHSVTVTDPASQQFGLR